MIVTAPATMAVPPPLTSRREAPDAEALPTSRCNGDAGPRKPGTGAANHAVPALLIACRVRLMHDGATAEQGILWEWRLFSVQF